MHFHKTHACLTVFQGIPYELCENPVNILVTVTRLQTDMHIQMDGRNHSTELYSYNNFLTSNISIYSFIFYYLNCEFLANV